MHTTLVRLQLPQTSRNLINFFLLLRCMGTRLCLGLRHVEYVWDSAMLTEVKVCDLMFTSLDNIAIQNVYC